MWYGLAADATALVHLVFILFVVFGVWLGRCHRWWRLAHLAAMAYGVLIEIFYWYCPLTYLEQYLRERAGQGSYSEPFIAHYLNRIIYLDVPQGVLIGAAIVVLGINSGFYYYSWRRYKLRHT
jgi:Protein of Unknown function (DUF2784)